MKATSDTLRQQQQQQTKSRRKAEAVTLTQWCKQHNDTRHQTLLCKHTQDNCSALSGRLCPAACDMIAQVSRQNTMLHVQDRVYVGVRAHADMSRQPLTCT
jgi:hypothetical protein